MSDIVSSSSKLPQILLTLCILMQILKSTCQFPHDITDSVFTTIALSVQITME